MPVDIHGTKYDMVWERVKKFHKENKDSKSIITEIIQFKDGVVVIKAVVKLGDNVFTGHAYEEIGSTQVNKTSALENGETSAIGRALASAGYIGQEFASADEVANAIVKQSQRKPKAKKEDLSGDKWRDNPIGFKSGKNEGKSYREVDDDTLIWIINECKVEAWKEKAIKEMQLRQEGQEATDSKEEVVSKEDNVGVDKKEVDNLFN